MWAVGRAAFSLNGDMPDPPLGGGKTLRCYYLSAMARVREKYSRHRAEKRFARVYEIVEGERCTYCGIASDGRYDHQPPVYVLDRFANGNPVTKRLIREHFGQCKLVPCCTVCNMGLGTYHGSNDGDRRSEIVNWFLEDTRFPEDKMILEIGFLLLQARIQGKLDEKVYRFPGVGRIIYSEALLGLIDGKYQTPDDFPDWLKATQSELAEWLRAAPRRKVQYFLDMANLESYELLPHARDNPRGQF